LPGKILEACPYGTEMIAIGNLTHTPLIINSGDILFNSKLLSGLLLFPWIVSKSAEERTSAMKEVADDLKNGGTIFGT